ncbi:heavy metal-binding domain-containing protein [Cupriavidus agavae]|uniref:Putative heavy-metal-binding protein n=1 Tax=Cupriavidus agavae TaxID=1001822 RepID=A0A4Q7RXJ7_9BURK|nr:heavy metal-binding domain-containing protein [Cupriavidus agavae]RZT38605.1 putative heavy-metal-binding protein [Cupriavidus agavae]
MKTTLRIALAVAATTAILGSGAASAADKLLNMPIEDALKSPVAASRIDPNIRLSWGFNRIDGAQDPVSFKSIKRVRRPTSQVQGTPVPTEAEQCQAMFVEALQELQQKASATGANAVMEIRSNWKDDETSSDKTYVCARGAAYIGVALKGTLAKVGG